MIDNAVKSILLWGMGLLLSGCGVADVDLTQKLVVAMMGVFDAPSDASGNSEPKFLYFTLTNLTIAESDEATAIDLYDEEPAEFRIIDRSQIIHEADISSYEGNTYYVVTVTFDPTVKGEGSTKTELTTTLTNTSLVLREGFTVQKAQSKRFIIKVQWKNTISKTKVGETYSETMSAPSFALDITNE